jgi:hypothetical protein
VRLQALALCLGLCGCRSAAVADNEVLEVSAQQFVFSDPEAWEVGETLELVSASDYAPPFRSPLSIALVEGHTFGDFTLEAQLMQTGREYGHRDLCLFFGFVDTANFYYVHLATTPDEHAHNVFIVDDAARLALAPVPDKGIDWGDSEWHRVRLERTLASGLIRVYFDDQLVHSLSDTTHGVGHIGFGSFDDTGQMRAIRIHAAPEQMHATPAAPFAP